MMDNETLSPDWLDALLARAGGTRNVWLHPYHAYDVYKYLKLFCKPAERPEDMTSVRSVDLKDRFLGRRYGVNIFWDADHAFLRFDRDNASCAVIAENFDGEMCATERFDATAPTG